VRSLIFRLATLAYHRRILFTDFFSQKSLTTTNYVALSVILQAKTRNFSTTLSQYCSHIFHHKVFLFCPPNLF